ncbi:hypothetical protein [Halioxenophilus aromaticivorans]|uniref:Uncharacterized protein n=1 Tax=Halioxenophilus aromaticivorans TaxID=1306992 RepID=A0AAV3U5S8_9ALTE
MNEPLWPFVVTFSAGLLTVALGAFSSLSCQRQTRIKQLIKQRLTPAFVGRTSDCATSSTNPGSSARANYAQNLEKQLELTATLQRVMAKTAHFPGNAPAARGQLQRALLLRQAILTAELAAQENPNLANGQPDWKTLQKGYSRIISLHQQLLGAQDAENANQETTESLKSHTSNTEPTAEKANNITSLSQVNQNLEHLHEELQQRVRVLSASDNRVKLLEAKLNLAQSQIASLQTKLNHGAPIASVPQLLNRVK